MGGIAAMAYSGCLQATPKNCTVCCRKGVLGVSDEPLVSVDYTSDPHSSVVDALSTSVMDGRMVKVLSWYDNEWGYSSRVVDLVGFVGARL